MPSRSINNSSSLMHAQAGFQLVLRFTPAALSLALIALLVTVLVAAMFFTIPLLSSGSRSRTLKATAAWVSAWWELSTVERELHATAVRRVPSKM